MGNRIIKQPDGKFGLFSTFSDRIYAYDMTEEEMIELWMERAAARAADEMRDWLAEVKGERPGCANPMTLDEALKEHRTHPKNAAEIWSEQYAPEVEWDEELLRKFPGKVRPQPEPKENDDAAG